MAQTELLERRSAITARQARAASEIYRCWALGIMLASNAEPTGNGSDPGGYTVAQLDAAKRYREIRMAVGHRLWPVVFAVSVEDFSPSRWANERGRGMHKAAAVELLRLGLDMAADVIGED
ncbi:MAG TPA: hypothetical protein VFD73_09800 [Gemmatimonadales bacterium]|nr:hypothetical protein [Gemmatimonadales bacterium]